MNFRTLKWSAAALGIVLLAQMPTAMADAMVGLDAYKVKSDAFAFDGIWAGSSNVTLIKQLEGYVILQGKDAISTWSAKGIINGNTVTCRGTGVQKGGVEFIYESTLVLVDGVLQDSWKAVLVGGKELKGSDLLHKADIVPHPISASTFPDAR